MNQEEIIANMEKCSHFNSCSQNFCPLDLELNFRSGGQSERCRFMREAKQTKIGEREFVSGGTIMPDAFLNFVPRNNLEWLNNGSQARWKELKKYENLTMQ